MLGTARRTGFLAIFGVSLLASPRPAAPGEPSRAALAAELRLVVAPAGNEARYRVREQLAGVNFPNDAVGATTEITGGIVIGDGGKVVKESSKFVINLASLKSDRDRRDNYIRTRTLETEQHPSAVLVPTELKGLPNPLPKSGKFTFTMVGDLTVRGVTRPTTWDVSAEASGVGYTGSASTTFTFDTFGLTKPRVAVVLTVEDTITLEYDFNLVPASP